MGRDGLRVKVTGRGSSDRLRTRGLLGAAEDLAGEVVGLARSKAPVDGLPWVAEQDLRGPLRHLAATVGERAAVGFEDRARPPAPPSGRTSVATSALIGVTFKVPPTKYLRS